MRCGAVRRNAERCGDVRFGWRHSPAKPGKISTPASSATLASQRHTSLQVGPGRTRWAGGGEAQQQGSSSELA